MFQLSGTVRLEGQATKASHSDIPGQDLIALHNGSVKLRSCFPEGCTSFSKREAQNSRAVTLGPFRTRVPRIKAHRDYPEPSGHQRAPFCSGLDRNHSIQLAFLHELLHSGQDI